MNHKNTLLWLLGALLCVKFVFAPWYEYQQQQLDEIQISAKKLNRALAIEGNEQSIDKELARLSAMNDELSQSLLSFENESNASLEFQRLWGQAFEERQLSIQMFNWTGQRQLGSSPYWVGRAVVTAEGSLHQTFLLFLEFQRQNPAIHLAELKVNNASGIEFQNSEQVSVTVDVLFKVTAP